MKNYMTMGALAKRKKPEGDPTGKAIVPFHEKAVMSIYSGPIPHKSQHKHKLTSRAVNAVSSSTLEYLHWSEFPNTFDQMDHPDNISKPGRLPLIVDPLVGTT
jgi:hypothetical protein